MPGGTLSEADRDRLHRARVIWADGGLESSGITVAFDLPTSAGTEAPSTRTAVRAPQNLKRPSRRRSFHSLPGRTVRRCPRRKRSGTGERLLDLVSSRVDLAAMLIDPGPGHGQVLLGRVLAANSFELTQAPGQRAGQNRLRFVIDPDDAGVLLLSAVRWWWDHGHWDVADGGPEVGLSPGSDESPGRARRVPRSALCVTRRERSSQCCRGVRLTRPQRRSPCERQHSSLSVMDQGLAQRTSHWIGSSAHLQFMPFDHRRLGRKWPARV